MAKWSPFRKIRFWVVYDPAKRQIGAPAKFKYQLAVPSRKSGRVIVEMTGLYPATQFDASDERG